MNSLDIERFSFGVVTDRLAECRRFYVELFDLKVVFAKDWYIHLRSADGRCDLGLLRPGRADQPPAFQAAFTGAGAWISFLVPDVNVVRNRAANLGFPLEMDVRDEPWGERHFAILDPAGVVVNVAERIAPFGNYARD